MGRFSKEELQLIELNGLKKDALCGRIPHESLGQLQSFVVTKASDECPVPWHIMITLQNGYVVLLSTLGCENGIALLVTREDLFGLRKFSDVLALEPCVAGFTEDEHGICRVSIFDDDLERVLFQPDEIDQLL